MFKVKKWDDGCFHVVTGMVSVEHFKCRDNAQYLASELNAALKRVQKLIPGRPANKKVRPQQSNGAKDG